MKRYLILLFLFIPFLCFSATGDLETINGKADTAISTIAGKAGTGIATISGKNYTDGDGAASNACDSSEGSIACEDFEGPRLSWTVVETGGTHDYAAHSGTLGCTDKGSYAVDILYPAANAADCYAYYDMSTGQYVMYVNLYINFVASPNFANGDVQWIMSASPATNGDTPAWGFAFKESTAEQRQFTVFYNNTTAMTWVNCNMGTWYRISITYIKINDSDDADSDDTIAWSLDGVEQQSITNANLTTSYVPRYLHISRRNEVANAESVNFQIDNIEVDGTDMPAACP